MYILYTKEINLFKTTLNIYISREANTTSLLGIVALSNVWLSLIDISRNK